VKVAEPTEVRGALVVLHVSPVHGAIGRDDAEIIIVPVAMPRGRSALLLVQATESHHDLGGDHQLDAAAGPTMRPGRVDRAGLALLPSRDLIAEEPRLIRTGVGDQGLVRGHLQLEIIAQEVPDARFDRLGFAFGPYKGQEEIIGVAHIPQAAVIGVV
jgi:hypothetical protein